MLPAFVRAIAPMSIPLMRLILLAGWLACASLAGAGEVTSRVELQLGELVIDHGRGLAEITRMQGNDGTSARYGLGLFLSHVEFESSVSGSPTRPGDVLVRTRIKTRPTLYIAREFAKGSCAYAVILDHERQHYQFDLEAVRALPAQAEGIAREVFASSAVRSEADLARAQARFLERLKHVHDQRMFPLHARIDAPESYRRLGAACDGEIGRTLKDAVKR